MLVLADRNFLSRDTRATGAHMLSWVSVSFKLTPLVVLTDPYLAAVHPARQTNGSRSRCG